jgi:hypothetical protein
VFSRLQRRQAQFFQEASAGLLALVRLAAHDDGDDDGEEDEESVQAIDGRNIVPLEQVRAAIVDDIVQVALTVREACIAVDVRFSFNASRSWQEGIVSCCLYLIAVQAFQVHFWRFHPVNFVLSEYSVSCQLIASVLHMLKMWESCRLTNIVKIFSKD